MTEPEFPPLPAAPSPAQPTEAQREYDSSSELRELLTRATASPTIRRARRR